MPGTRAYDVAVPLPFQSPFTYAGSEDGHVAQRGCRVLVPFGGRKVIGVVTGPATSVPDQPLKPVLELLDDEPLPPPALLDLAAWVADHYMAAPGECYRLVLPPSGVKASTSSVRAAACGREPDARDEDLLAELRCAPLSMAALTRRLGRDAASVVARLRRQGLVTVEHQIATSGFRVERVAVLVPGQQAPKALRQREILEALAASGGRQRVADLTAAHPSLRSALAALVRAARVTVEDVRVERRPDTLDGDVPRHLTLTGAQRDASAALEQAVDAASFQPFLLFGVTGSGKTEVYFRAAAAALAKGRSVLLLVPEIALTPFVVRGATARFGDTVAVIHSDLSPGERHDQWWRIRDGGARLVIGARSAVFAPLPDLGLVIVDEEHDGAYKQEDAPRYSARDVAVMRAKLESVPVVLGSATPSIESFTNAERGKYRLLSLPTRIGSQGLPSIAIVDRRAILRQGGERILTPPLVEALTECLDRSEQALLLLNRRGYAQCLVCRECGIQASCPNCSVSLTVHALGQTVECHYCGYAGAPPRQCSSCRGEYLRLTGYGTERVLEALREALPRVRAERVDRDLARRRGAVARTLRAFEEGTLDVLVGTQMIAKGHDFPRVTLVGVVDADVGLGLPDFRAAERTFQILTQVAGRAGRGERPGRVVLQSLAPDHYALVHACAQDFAGFVENEREFRRTMGYPPFLAMVHVVVRSEDASRAQGEATGLARGLRAVPGRRFQVLGPAAAPLARIQREHRWQILLKGARGSVRQALRSVLEERYGRQRWPGIAVDVDPLSIM